MLPFHSYHASLPSSILILKTLSRGVFEPRSIGSSTDTYISRRIIAIHRLCLAHSTPTPRLPVLDTPTKVLLSSPVIPRTIMIQLKPRRWWFVRLHSTKWLLLSITAVPHRLIALYTPHQAAKRLARLCLPALSTMTKINQRNKRMDKYMVRPLREAIPSHHRPVPAAWDSSLQS